MRIETAEHLEAFRAQLRAFIAQHSPGIKQHTGVRAPADDLVPAIRTFTAALFDAGYLGGDWPEEHGGRGAAYDSREAFIVAEEIALARTWAPIGAFQLAAPALIDFGTDEQKRPFLPRIRRAEAHRCQHFSVPGARRDPLGSAACEA